MSGRHHHTRAGRELEEHAAHGTRRTYLIPHGVDRDALDHTFFNVDYLLEYGYTGAEHDAIPVVARFPADRAVSAADAGAFGGTNARALPTANGRRRGHPRARPARSGRRHDPHRGPRVP
ncbi:hypothetical protein [Natrononativus amylolyticus]|uniref:hypothetical protein n=1 Tax=Natrononativus amylolyticus TaxID=2963434 RepID=UPI0020CDBDF4|nr:hypothetical protein [Natrononativus amylolyticus]